jgi:hypothetical protein
MSRVMYCAPGVEMTLLRRSLTVMRLAVGVLTLPLYLMRSPPMVNQMRFDSAL